MPILGGDGLDSEQLAKGAGKAAEGTVVASIFDPTEGRDDVGEFIRKYKAEYGKIPGKDAVRRPSPAAAHRKSGRAQAENIVFRRSDERAR